ncbi:hypothetical protein [Chryseobacterium sp.]|uniref:hypothetical protein n=1 Tax=Chryseobacterium sp. TaxID=1871047 RepID=UPI001B1B4BCD|nr:hypothetical protein [Chryseobacterium sp.]MBO9691197.1 hypothetical protein [Chryseobacterium sp.]
MRFITSILFAGFIVLSCKKESRTETSVTHDSVIADTMTADTVSNSAPMAPLPSDTVRADTLSSKRNSDTVRTPKNKKNQ